jgi:hypothetical protein
MGDEFDANEQTPMYPWQRPYIAAVLETDRSKLAAMIVTAESSVRARITELDNDHGGTVKEQRALLRTLNALATLRRETN